MHTYVRLLVCLIGAIALSGCTANDPLAARSEPPEGALVVGAIGMTDERHCSAETEGDQTILLRGEPVHLAVPIVIDTSGWSKHSATARIWVDWSQYPPSSAPPSREDTRTYDSALGRAHRVSDWLEIEWPASEFEAGAQYRASVTISVEGQLDTKGPELSTSQCSRSDSFQLRLR